MASGRVRADDGRHRGQGPRRQDLHACAPPARWSSSTASSRSTRKAATTESRTSRRARRITPRTTTRTAACRRSPKATAVTDRSHRGRAAFHAAAAALSRKRRWSSGWKSSASAGPSTYASTLAVLQERDYVRIDKKRLIPEDKGRLVIAFLESFFKQVRRVRLHGRARGEARSHLDRRAGVQGGAARLLARLHGRRRRASRTCASATCSKR